MVISKFYTASGRELDLLSGYFSKDGQAVLNFQDFNFPMLQFCAVVDEYLPGRVQATKDEFSFFSWDAGMISKNVRLCHRLLLGKGLNLTRKSF
jgi:hypothetical protein